MADFSIASSIRSLSFIGARPVGLPAVVKRRCRATWLAITGHGDRPTQVHPLINKVVNRTPPITRAIQVRSVALKVTQSFQPSRKIPSGHAPFSETRQLRCEPVAALFRPAVRLSPEPPRAPPGLFRRSESEPYPCFAPAVARLQSACRPEATRAEAALHRSPPCRFPQGAPRSVPLRLNGCMKVTVLLVVRTVMGVLDPSMNVLSPLVCISVTRRSRSGCLRSSAIKNILKRRSSATGHRRLEPFGRRAPELRQGSYCRPSTSGSGSWCRVPLSSRR